ncbi:MAG: hypothetical protein E7404_03355 [Ruminococcaceae bacterium]|nr:hypothetical protein [Oscillospiraceae bacterium]
MKRMKKLLSCILAISILLSMAVIDVAAISIPASLMGKYVKLGTFDGNDMVWYVAARDNVNEDAISDYYLIKAEKLMEAGYARSDSGNRQFNRWSKSDLREYLNSNANAGEVAFDKTNNTIETVSAGYADKAGFLTNFTTSERAIMLPVTHKSVISNYHKGWTPPADAVDSGTDVKWLPAGNVYEDTTLEAYMKHTPYDNDSTLGKRWRFLDYYTNIDGNYTIGETTYTEVPKEETTDYIFVPSIIDAYKYKLPLFNLIPTNDKAMWLRDVTMDATDGTYFLNNAIFYKHNISRLNGRRSTDNAYVVPAMFIDGSIKYNVTGDGTKENPYTLVWEKSCDDLVGKYVYLGQYGPSADEKYPIKWYVAGSKDVDGDGTEEYYTIASEIIDLKEMSTWGGMSHQSFNSAQWASTALRAWLNSDESTVSAYGKYVTEDDNKQTIYNTESTISNHMQVGTPSYSDEAGFLTNFTAGEKAIIKPVTHKYLMGTIGYKAGNAKDAGFEVGGEYNMLEQSATCTSGTYNSVPNAIVPGTTANDIWQGVHTGRAADNEDVNYFWIDALTNINGVRGNNFGEDTFDSTARYVETTDLVFVPSLFDVADFGGEMLKMNKANNNLNVGYQCGSDKPSDANNGGYVWMRDLLITASWSGANACASVYSPVVGPRALSLANSYGVQPAMYISSDIVTSGLGTYAEPLTVVTSDTADADGQVEITKDELTNKVTATAHIYNKTNDTKNFVVIIAKYITNEDGNLVLEIADMDDLQLSNTDDPTTISASLDYEEGATYKAFIWDNLSIAPYSQAKSY